MKKYRVTVTVPVSVEVMVNAEDTDDARQKTEDVDFSLNQTFGIGGLALMPTHNGATAIQGEPDYENIAVSVMKK